MKKFLCTVGLMFFVSTYLFAQIQIQSGTFSYSAAESKAYSLHANEGKRLVEYEIKFEKPFNKKPKVVISTTMLDAVKSGQLHYSIRATNISREGFVLVAEVWGDTQLNAIGGNWLAHTEE